MKINEVDKVTTLAAGECITAIAADGSLIQIPVSELGKVMAQVMPVATSEKNGLMSYKDKIRYIPQTITYKNEKFVKLAVLKGQASLVCLLNFGRIEGTFATTHCLSAFQNDSGGGDAQITKISGKGIVFYTYKKVINNRLEIYIDTISDYNYIEGLALTCSGGAEIVIEKLNHLPDGCVAL